MVSERRGSADQKLRKRLRQNIQLGRLTLLVVMGLSLVNQLLLLLNVNYHLLFSAATPYYLNWLPREMSRFQDVTFFRVMAMLLTILIFAAYVLCWMRSARSREWLLATVGLYGVDTVLLVVVCFFLENPVSCVLEILTHLVVLALLAYAYYSAQQLKKLPKRRRPAPAEQVQA